jgi:uncharacterized protein YjbI with pentapeptide repeats
MADKEHLSILYQGVPVWNTWRQSDWAVAPDLSGAVLDHMDLTGAMLDLADLRGASLREAVLVEAKLVETNLAKANLTGADLKGAILGAANLSDAELCRSNLRDTDLNAADLSRANLEGADLSWAHLSNASLFEANLVDTNLFGADLRDTNLTKANLRGANLSEAILIRTKLQKAILTGCKVYGISAWDLQLEDLKDQTDLIITPTGQSAITVDNIEIAQFIYLLLRNEKIRGVIDTVGRKGVLLLGRFSDERKAVLEAIKARLRERDLVPIVFDWEKPSRRDLTETVQLLANMSRFVVADITDARSIPQELSHIVPFLPSVPVCPIILAEQFEYDMFEHWKGYNNMLSVFRYEGKDHLLDNIDLAVLRPVEEWELVHHRAKTMDRTNSDKDEEIARLRALLDERDAK